jgi:hypothetical protein
MFRTIILPIFRSIRLYVTACPSVKYCRSRGRKVGMKIGLLSDFGRGYEFAYFQGALEGQWSALWTSKFIKCSTCRERKAAGLASLWRADWLGIVTWLAKYQLNFSYTRIVHKADTSHNIADTQRKRRRSLTRGLLKLIDRFGVHKITQLVQVNAVIWRHNYSYNVLHNLLH